MPGPAPIGTDHDILDIRRQADGRAIKEDQNIASLVRLFDDAFTTTAEIRVVTSPNDHRVITTGAAQCVRLRAAPQDVRRSRAGHIVP